MSYTRAALLLASVLATFAMGPLLKVVSYRHLFPGMCLFGLAAAVVFGRIPVPEAATGAGERVIRRGLGESFRAAFSFLASTLGIFRTDHGYRWFALSVFTYGFGNLMIVPVIPFIQVDRLHISTNHIALLANLAQIVGAVSYFYWGRYVDRNSPLKAVVVNILLNAMIPVIYLTATNKWMLVPAFLLSGITQAGIDLSYFNSVLSFAKEEMASRYQALHSFLLGIRGVTAPLIGGFLFQVLRENGLDMRWLFVLGLTFILTGCWMQVVGIRRRRRDTGQQQVAYT
jgi:hypothetical protein